MLYLFTMTTYWYWGLVFGILSGPYLFYQFLYTSPPPTSMGGYWNLGELLKMVLFTGVWAGIFTKIGLIYGPKTKYEIEKVSGGRPLSIIVISLLLVIPASIMFFSFFVLYFVSSGRSLEKPLAHIEVYGLVDAVIALFLGSLIFLGKVWARNLYVVYVAFASIALIYLYGFSPLLLAAFFKRLIVVAFLFTDKANEFFEGS